MRQIVSITIGSAEALYSVARRVTCRIRRPPGMTALDLQHEAIAVILAEAHRFPDRYSDRQFVGWLGFIVAKRLTRMLQREYNWDYRRFTLEGERDDPDFRVAAQLVDSADSLSRLKAHEREVVELLVQGFQAKEIARFLGKSSSAVRMTLKRLRSRICELR